MKYLVLLLIAGFYFSISSQAQVGTLTSGQEFIPALPLKCSGGGYLGLEKRPDVLSGSNWNKFRQSLTIVHYDANMKRIKDVRLSDGKSAYSAHYTELKKSGDKYWLLYLEPAEGNAVGNIMALEISSATLETGTPKIIADKKSIDLEMKFMGAITHTFKIFTAESPTGNYQSVYISTGKGDFFIGCMDQQMNIVWQRRDAIEKVKDKDINSIAVDDKGSIYLGYTKKADGYVGVYSKIGGPVHQQIIVEENDIRDVLIISNKDKKAIDVAGSYMANDYCKGVYTATLGDNGKPGIVTLTSFPEHLLKQLDKENFANSKKGLYQTYDANLHRMEDGSLTMVAEMQKTIYDNITRTMTGSVIVIHFGKSTLFAKVPKYSATGGIGEPQYLAQPCGNNILIFYYDNSDNLTRDINLDAKALGKNAVFMVATVKLDASVDRKQLGYSASLTTAMQYMVQTCR